MGLDESFNNPPSKNQWTEAMFEAWLKHQERKRNQLIGLAALTVIIGGLVLGVFAVTGVI